MDKRKSGGSSYGLIAVILLVASFVISWKFVLPEYKTKNQERLKLNAEIEAAENKISALATTKSQLDGIKDTVDKVFIAVPEGKDMPNLVSELEAIASKHKTYIPSIQAVSAAAATTTESTESNPANNTIAFSASGSFEDLTAFVTSLEGDLRFFNIKNLAYSYSDKDNIMTLSVQIDLPARQTL
ncbi:MAG TPA: type 4a pilus biogenesis protein PilO [bacterium]|nr:type 4a pilus biogenesis protein PilO [bacterium]